MKKAILGLLGGLALGAGVAWQLLPRPAATAASAPAAQAKPAEKPKENPLHFPAAKRTAAGIVLARPAEVTLPPEVEVFGRVLDPTSLVTLAAELTAANAAADATTKEEERMKKLFAAGNNASVQAMETAEAAAQRDRSAVASARVRLMTTWGPRFADEARLVPLVDALAAGQALIRLDALPGDLPVATPTTARVGLLDGQHFEAEILGPALMTDAQVSGISFLALVANHPLAIGASLRGTVPGPGDPVKVLAIPRSAVVYHQGSAWVYALGEEDTFERKLVALGRALDDRIAVTSGLEADQQVIATGAQQVLAAELQAGEAPEEP